MRTKPSYKLEKKLLQNGVDLIFGMDEVGRGSFAGPLVAAAVCFEKQFKWFTDLNDSKLLSAKERNRLSKLIIKHTKYFIEEINIESINRLGIGKCNQLVFEQLIKKISKEHNLKKLYYLIDGNKQKINRQNLEFIVKGDGRVVSIAAASIIAKVYRDNLMKILGKQFPGYNFAKNKGYGTKFHQEAIKKLGLCSIHRKSFDLKRFL
jgi:ribonuclease HII